MSDTGKGSTAYDIVKKYTEEIFFIQINVDLDEKYCDWMNASEKSGDVAVCCEQMVRLTVVFVSAVGENPLQVRADFRPFQDGQQKRGITDTAVIPQFFKILIQGFSEFVASADRIGGGIHTVTAGNDIDDAFFRQGIFYGGSGIAAAVAEPFVMQQRDIGI